MLTPRSHIRRIIRRLAWKLIRPEAYPRSGVQTQYAAAYVASLNATLDVIEQEKPSIGAALTPIYLDSPDTDQTDFLIRGTGRVFRADMRPLAGSQRAFARRAAWKSFNTFMTVQPALCLRMSARAQTHAARIAVMSDDASVRAPAIGSWSVFVLIAVNNMLCLHRLLRTGPDKRAWTERWFGLRFALGLSRIKRSVHTAFRYVEATSGVRQTGDLVFVDSLMPALKRMRGHTPPLPYVNRLKRASPLTLMRELDEDRLWMSLSHRRLAGIETLLTTPSAFNFTATVVQYWTDALIRASGSSVRVVFDRIEGMLDGLNSASEPGSLSAAGVRLRFDRTDRSCLVWLVRYLLRAWPDVEQRLTLPDTTPGRRRQNALIWQEILARLQRRVEQTGCVVAGPTTGEVDQRALTASECHALRRCLARTHSIMPLAAS